MNRFKSIIYILLCCNLPVYAAEYDNPCDYYKLNLSIKNKHNIPSIEVPKEIYEAGAKCYEFDGNISQKKLFLAYATMFGYKHSYFDLLLSKFKDKEELEFILASMSTQMDSNDEFVVLNAKTFLGAYYSYSENVIIPPHMTKKEIRTYGNQLLIEASKFKFGFIASYYLSFNRNYASDEREKYIEIGDKQQLNYYGKVQERRIDTYNRWQVYFKYNESLIEMPKIISLH